MARRTKAAPKAAASEANLGDSTARRVPLLKVLLSSRNRDLIPRRGGGAVSLLQVRKETQAAIEDETLCGKKIFDVWINEEAGGPAGNDNIWQACQKEITDRHIVIAIVNGEAGWQRQPGGVGICYEEIKYAFHHFPAKLYVIGLDFASDPELGLKGPRDAALEPANRDFATFLQEIKLWQTQANDDQSLKEKIRLALAKAVSDLAIDGSRAGHKGRYSFGTPLDWSRLGYQERKTEIEKAVASSLLKLGEMRELEQDPSRPAKSPSLVWDLQREPVLISIHGVPSSFGIAEARELVGRPFLFDHASPVATRDSDLAGPVHLIACHKSCTESQIFTFMGHPDVYIVQADFGFFAADLSTFVQTFFLTGCRDATDTAMALESLFEWLDVAEERAAIVTRARARQRILRAVRTEIDAHAKMKRR